MSRTIIVAALALTLQVSTSWAEHHEEGHDFATQKSKISKEVDEHLKALQDHKSCIDGAQDKEALKACREKMKDYRQENMSERMEKKKDRLEKRMEKMKEKKK